MGNLPNWKTFFSLSKISQIIPKILRYVISPQSVFFLLLFFIIFVFGVFPENRPDPNIIRKFSESMVYQAAYFQKQIRRKNYPRLGIYLPFTEETSYFEQISEEINKEYYKDLINDKNASHKVTYNYYSVPTYPTIVSLDYETGNLYVGFTKIPFLQDSFYKKIKKNDRSKYELFIRTKVKSINNLVQNAKGEPYSSGDTLMHPVIKLSREEIERYYPEITK
jgi:hypothetical protein